MKRITTFLLSETTISILQDGSFLEANRHIEDSVSEGTVPGCKDCGSVNKSRGCLAIVLNYRVRFGMGLLFSEFKDYDNEKLYSSLPPEGESAHRRLSTALTRTALEDQSLVESAYRTPGHWGLRGLSTVRFDLCSAGLPGRMDCLLILLSVVM